MGSQSEYVFKVAESTDEFDAIARLNHETFAVEIAQHSRTGDGRLVDFFDHKNTYFIAVRNGRLCGMIAVHDQPPFSIEKRLPDAAILDRYPGPKLEVRLLAIRPEERQRMVLTGLLWMVLERARSGYAWVLISAFERQLGLYRKLGFKAVGEPVAAGEALFVPMVLGVPDLPEHVLKDARLWEKRRGDNDRSG